MWKNYYTGVKISDSNEPIWIPKVSLTFLGRLKLWWYEKFGQYKENDNTKWLEWKNKKLILAITFEKKMKDAQDNLYNEICSHLFGG